MITRADLDERVAEWQLRDDVVEKDFLLGWLLWGIGRHERLAATWAFKGGTCLKKCYVETFRFSEDLDFTVLPGGPFRPEDVAPLLRDVLDAVSQESGIDFSGREPALRLLPDGRSTQGRIYYRGPRRAPQDASVKLDLSAAERIVRPTVLRAIGHEYPDRWGEGASVRCYSFDEVFAEKLRALGERCRPRDLYDVVNLYRRKDLHSHAAHLREVLEDKCQSKGVPRPTLASVATPDNRHEVEAEWENMLRHQLPALPPFVSFWDELSVVFAWLDGAAVPIEPAELPSQEPLAAGWSPPPLIALWGAGTALEAIRFAAVNRLCVDLHYGNKVRRIEPYALRRTRDGHLIVQAIRVDSRENRSYRVDRMGPVHVTEQVFTPRYAVAFSALGNVEALPAPPRVIRVRAPRGTRARHGLVHIVECSWCRKHFRRRSHDWTLRPHKDRGGWPCPGRRGWLVDTRWV